MKNSIFSAFMLSLSFVLVGCGGGGDELTVFPVTGKITKAGAPLAGVSVLLLPQAGTEAPMLIGNTLDDGTFEITTNAGQTGAPAGDYKVTLRAAAAEMDYDTGKPKDNPAGDAIPEKYTSEETTDEKFTVSADGENVITIDLP